MADQRKNVTLRIRQVGDKDLKKIVRGLDQVQRRTRSIQTNLAGLRRVFFAIFGGLGLRQLFGAADSVQLLSDRIKVFTGDADSAKEVLNDLFTAADATNTSIDSLAETFNRVALATKELGLTTEELVGFTATLQNTFRLSGASIAEASGAAIQLSQGLASGQLRGQELRSVLESNAVIGQLLADTLGTTRGQLIKFAETGRITSDVVINALSKNAKTLNDQASQLGQTFGQTLTKSFNQVKIRINELNRDLRLNERFAKAVDLLVNNLDRLVRGLVIVASAGIIASIGKIGAAILAVATPVNAAVAGLALFVAFFDKIKIAAEIAFKTIAKGFISISRNINELIVKAGSSDNFLIKKLFGSPKQVALAKRRLDETSGSIANLNKDIDELKKQLSGTEKPTKDILNAFSDLKEINLPQSVTNSADSIKVLNKQLAEGFITAKEYNTEFRKIQETDLTRRFNEGQVSAQQFSNELIKIRELNDTFTEKIFTGFQLAATNYATTVGTLTSQLQRGFEASFNKLEDVIFQSLKQGKFLFQDFAQFVLDELLKIQIRAQIIAPISQGLGSLFTPDTGIQGAQTTTTVGNSSSFSSVAAKGQVYSMGRQMAFASGGILNSPTMFPLNSGMGLAGEAGPEAVVPLTRTSSGDLGVKANPSNVVVNVNNQAGVEVDVQSTQLGNDSVLEVTITKAINRAINTGRLDRTLNNNFGLNRKGNR
jgi:lambda family phage tail tape measure protein